MEVKSSITDSTLGCSTTNTIFTSRKTQCAHTINESFIILIRTFKKTFSRTFRDCEEKSALTKLALVLHRTLACQTSIMTGLAEHIYSIIIFSHRTIFVAQIHVRVIICYTSIANSSCTRFAISFTREAFISISASRD